MKTRWIGLGSILAALALAGGFALIPSAQEPAEPNEFQKFQREQIMELRKLSRKLQEEGASREEMLKRSQSMMKQMVERFEEFRDSDKGKPYRDEANEFIIQLSMHTGNALEKAQEIIKAEEDPKDAAELKLFVARTIGRQHAEEARKLVQEVLDNSKEKWPKVHASAERAMFALAEDPVGKPFPEFPEGAKDLDGKPIRIADCKGKVVMVDFWAAWCGPCMQEAPNVVKAYKEYHPKGFEIIGISLDQDKSRMASAIKKFDMPWRQYFDGKGWSNEVSRAYGISAIPATYLVGPDGKVVAKNVRGSALEPAIEKALAKTE